MKRTSNLEIKSRRYKDGTIQTKIIADGKIIHQAYIPSGQSLRLRELDDIIMQNNLLISMPYKMENFS